MENTETKERGSCKFNLGSGQAELECETPVGCRDCWHRRGVEECWTPRCGEPSCGPGLFPKPGDCGECGAMPGACERGFTCLTGASIPIKQR